MKQPSKSIIAIKDFFFRPASPRPLGVLRIGVAAVLIVQAFLIRKEVLELFGQEGLVQGALAPFFSSSFSPSLRGIAPLLGMNDSTVVYASCFLYLTSLVFLGLGLFTRVFSVVAWFLHWTLVNTGSTTSYGIDAYAHVFLFYFIFMPVGAAYSLDVIFNRVPSDRTWESRLAIRVLQFQLCITYFTSAVQKAKGIQWWNGELMWRALTLPVYKVYSMEWLAYYPWLSKIVGWGALFLEGGYPFFIWPKSTRKIWVVSVVGMHLGIALFLGLGTFGCIMAVLTFAIFGVSPESKTVPTEKSSRTLLNEIALRFHLGPVLGQ